MEKLLKLNDCELRSFLWQLFYNKENTLKLHELGDVSADEVIEFILKETEKNSRDLKIGKNESVLDTLGIDIGIKNPIVRDIVISRCYEAVFQESHNILKAAKLLKTSDDGTSFTSKKIFGGLLEIGFSTKEAAYIRQTCNTYPIGLLLERLEEKNDAEYEKIINTYSPTPQPKIEVEKEEQQVIEVVPVKEEIKEVVIENVIEEDNIDKFTILSNNIDSLAMFITYINNEEIDEKKYLIQKISSLEAELRMLKNGIENIEKLSGIDLEYILEKREILEKLVRIKGKL